MTIQPGRANAISRDNTHTLYSSIVCVYCGYSAVYCVYYTVYVFSNVYSVVEALHGTT